MLSASRLRERQEGAVAILVALTLIVLLAAVALVVDVGGLYLRRRELVNGADAAAMSAARTCTRGGFDTRFASPEDAADYQVRENAPITGAEVGPTNITDMTPCVGSPQYGHVSIQYTSQQSLYFAQVLGFGPTSPVTTAATASWGLGSNNPVPMVVSDLFAPGACPLPPRGQITIGEVCAYWYDNDALLGGNFTFLSLDPHGWDVQPGDSCNQAGGTAQLTRWITGEDPASVHINWTDPTYVCSDSGIKGVGNDPPSSQLWRAVDGLAGQIRDFPINWEGPGAPPVQPPLQAPAQGTIYTQSGSIEKYDIIGFAAMRIVDVVTPSAATTTATCQLVFTATTQQQDLTTCIPAGGVYKSYKFTPGKYQCVPLNGTMCTIDPVLKTNETATATVTFETYTSCGPPPPNSSAVCIILEWRGSTLSGDYPEKDNITVIRLCDRVYATCLDQ